MAGPSFGVRRLEVSGPPLLVLKAALPVALLVVLFALPYLVPVFGIVMVSSALILGLLAAALNIVVGYCGMVSIGHGAFFVVGAYASALFFVHSGAAAVVGLLAATVAGGLFGACFALVAQFVRGGYLVMLTIALLQVVASLVETFEGVTGGSDGLTVPTPTVLPGWGDLSSLVARYWFLVGAVAVCLLLLYGVVRAPLGRSFQALRQNEARLECLGYQVLGIKTVAWTVSGAAAAYAGCLSAVNHQLVSASDVSFQNSAMPLLVLCIVGTRGLLPAFAGALVIVLVRDQMAPYVLGRQILLLGCLFVVAAYLFPGGVSWRSVREAAGRLRFLVRGRRS